MSGRSSHLVPRLQTLPSALAGVSGSRRLLALAAVLALLVLALLPTTGQAQSDTTPPALESATVEPDGTTITLVFDEPYDLSSISAFVTIPFSVTAAGSTVTLTWSGKRDADLKYRIVLLTELSPAIEYGQDVIVTYTDPTTGDDTGAVFQDAAGNDVASFTTGSGSVPAVVNNVQGPPANAPPTFTSAASFSVAENQTAVDLVEATDEDAVDTVSYAITGGADQAKFDIDASSGVLTFKDAPDHENPTDAGGNNTYMVTVTATGGRGDRAMTAEQTITVTVTDVAEPPSAPATPTVSAVSGSSDSLSVSWTAPDNSGKPDISSYDLQYRKGDSGDFTDGHRT